jgi:general secretion pathway protein F
MRYRVKALAAGGTVSVVTLDADTAAQADRLARERGLAPISVRSDWSPAGWLPRRRQRFALALFAQQLIALLEAGLGTVEALDALSHEQRSAGAGVLARLLEQVRAGQSLSAALEQQPESFPPLFVATIRASERTGDLKEALQRYVDYGARIEALRRRLVSASIYPALLAGTGALVLAFLMFYVVPRFSQIYEDIGGQLPLLSQLLMRWGQLLAAHGVGVLFTLAALVVAALWLLAQPAVRGWLWSRLWSIPRLGEMLRIYELARLYRTLGMLLRSGTPLPASLAMAEGLLDPALRRALAAARQQISEGLPIADTLARHRLTTPVAFSMLRVGERSGELGPMMDRVAALYDDDLSRWVDVATRLIEPLLMVLIGVLIGVIVVLLYLPVFELANSLK